MPDPIQPGWVFTLKAIRIDEQGMQRSAVVSAFTAPDDIRQLIVRSWSGARTEDVVTIDLADAV